MFSAWKTKKSYVRKYVVRQGVPPGPGHARPRQAVYIHLYGPKTSYPNQTTSYPRPKTSYPRPKTSYPRSFLRKVRVGGMPRTR